MASGMVEMRAVDQFALKDISFAGFANVQQNEIVVNERQPRTGSSCAHDDSRYPERENRTLNLVRVQQRQQLVRGKEHGSSEINHSEVFPGTFGLFVGVVN